MLHHPVLFTIGETGGCGRWRPLQGVGLIRGPGFPLGGHDYCGKPSGKSLTPTYAVFLSSWELIAMCPVHCSYARCRSLSVAPSQTHGKGKKGT